MIVGLHGKYQSGKDTTFEFLKEWAEAQGFTATRDAFADRLKISAAHALGVFEDEIDFCNELKQEGTQILVLTPDRRHGGPPEVDTALTGREYLQYYGTEAHREVFDTDFWVDAVLSKEKVRHYQNHGGPMRILGITDVRFPNEGEAIQRVNGMVWHVVRPELDNSGDTHASEQPLPSYLIDRTIINDGSLDDLRDRVFGIMHEMQTTGVVLDGAV